MIWDHVVDTASFVMPDLGSPASRQILLQEADRCASFGCENIAHEQSPGHLAQGTKIHIARATLLSLPRAPENGHTALNHVLEAVQRKGCAFCWQRWNGWSDILSMPYASVVRWRLVAELHACKSLALRCALCKIQCMILSRSHRHRNG